MDLPLLRLLGETGLQAVRDHTWSWLDERFASRFKAKWGRGRVEPFWSSGEVLGLQGAKGTKAEGTHLNLYTLATSILVCWYAVARPSWYLVKKSLVEVSALLGQASGGLLECRPLRQI